MLYKRLRPGTQGTRLGDQLFYGVAWSVPLTHGTSSPEHRHDHAARDPGHHDAGPRGLDVGLVLEVNGEWQGRQEIDGVGDPDSGGNTVWLSPGLRVTSPDGWLAFLSVGTPAVQNLHGAHVEAQWRVSAGMSWSF